MAGNADILDGYKFSATLQLRTPLRVIQHHGARHRGKDVPPQVAGEAWHGTWLPVVKGWDELGLTAGATCASDIGQVPSDGGDYLQFLLKWRQAFESTEDEEQRRALRALLDSAPAYLAFEAQHGGLEAMIAKASGKRIRSRKPAPK